MLASVNGVFLEQNNIKKKITSAYVYQLYHTPLFQDYVFLAMDSGIGVLEKKNNQWEFTGKINGVDAPVLRITNDRNGFLFAGQNKFFKIDFSKGVIPNPNIETIRINGDYKQDDVFYLFSYRDQIEMGSTYEGFYHYNSKQNQFVRDPVLNKALGKDREVASPYVDNENNLWLFLTIALEEFI